MRQYPNLKEGRLEHDGNVYTQPENDSQFRATVELGDLLDVNDHFELWIFSGCVAIVRNEIGILE